MRLLCVHQNFPGQFRDLAPALVKLGHELKAISSCERNTHPEIEILRYVLPKTQRDGIHRLTGEVDEWVRRSELAAQQAEILRQRGWAPDAILAHPGWGESLLLRDIFPSSPLVLWPELWLRPEHMGLKLDRVNLEQKHYLRCKNALMDAALAEAEAVIVPTRYQAGTFPARWSRKINIIHEGVNSELFSTERLQSLTLAEGITLSPDIPVVTFVSRNLEPMRGFPEFMRALPKLQMLNQEAHVVIVGGDAVSYSSSPSDGKNWRETMLEEVGRRLDSSRIHWFSHLNHGDLIKIYRRSNLHVYLSEAFVLSWSLTEVMACGTPILARANAMTEELISNGVNGCLHAGDSEDLATKIAELLQENEKTRIWGKRNRTRLKEALSLDQCVERLEKVLKDVALQY